MTNQNDILILLMIDIIVEPCHIIIYAGAGSALRMTGKGNSF